MAGIQLDINGRAYDGIDVKILMLGTIVRGCSAASYTYDRNHNNNYALGSDEPFNYSMGFKNYQPGSMTLYMEEVVAIEDATKGDKDITKIKPFKTYFTHLNDAGKVVVDEVIWKFAGWGRELSIDSDGSGREFPMHIIGVRNNITL